MASTISTILKTCNPPEGKKLGFLAKWLVITRACVFSMTITSGLVGVMLALRDGYFSWTLVLLVLVGLIFAHAANNVLNDLMDYRSGVDTKDYFRVQYSPHPIHSGMSSQRGLLIAFLLFTLIDFALMLYFINLRGIGILYFALAGFLISVLYVGGTYSLKFTGLGELGVFLVWGPLMVGGTYLVLAGSVPYYIYLASIPYALLVTTVILGKHIDKRKKDASKKIKTLPVILGEVRSIGLIKLLIIAFYLTVLVESILGIIPMASLFALLSYRRALLVWKKLSQPKPESQPPDWPIWPLWYVGWCFHLVKQAGGFLIGGMFLQIILTFFLFR